MKTGHEILELVNGHFQPTAWSDFVRLTLREIIRRPFVLKACGLYFVGDGWGTDVGKIVARRHPGKVRHLIEWLEVILPVWTSAAMGTPLMRLPMRKINDGEAGTVLARIQALTKLHAEASS